ncbi:prothoracicostatic peptides-like [Saccostrea echinata]|uniref:prothoracicostatic peptides-like n=1 Tax=Saccostrea echinata TaxID=191078 RepID=UPI002A8185BB|nr:prothoracicostatic peptides-like [Saccostrea echinata]
MHCDLHQLYLSSVILSLVKVCACLRTKQIETSVTDHDIVKRHAGLSNSYGDELEGYDLDPKRDNNNWDQFPAWGKRQAKRRWSSFSAWGKRGWLDRLISANNNWGKRWKSMSNSWGKRQAPMEYDGLNDEYINIKKRSVNPKSRNKRSISSDLSSGKTEEKRRWSSLSAWGKRSDDSEKRRWSSFSAWGKRSEPENSNSHDSEDDITKRKWSSLSAWGKRSDPADRLNSDEIIKRKWSSFSSWGKRGLPSDISKRLQSYWRQRLLQDSGPWMERRGWNALTSWGK